MKKLFLILSVLLFTSCAVLPPTTNFYLTDLREYTNDGFIISPYAPKEDFLSIAFVAARSSYGTDTSTTKYNYTNQLGNTVTGNIVTKEIVPGNYNKAMSELVSGTKALGANALYDVKITKTGTAPYIYWEISGFAVKLNSKK